MRRFDWFKLAVSLLLPQLAGGIGALFTSPAIPGWYSQLIKPSFTPPSWLFGPAWTALFVMMGVALFLVWQSRAPRQLARAAYVTFGVQLGLNVLWSALFFGLRQPLWAFAEIVVLWLAILATILMFGRVRPAAAWLLVPYLAWVTFASCLNYAIVLAN